MRLVKTISISLEPEYERKLQLLAKKTGGNSAAVRHLLDALDVAEREKVMEEDYRAFYSDPAAARDSSAFNLALLSIASWLPQDQGEPRAVKPKRRTPR